MRLITDDNRRIGAILAFVLIPLAGFATDLYLPSFPEMMQAFKVTEHQIQLSLVVFLISYGIGQFSAGALMDTLGRYRPLLWALALFLLSNLLIINTTNVFWLYVARVAQGVTTALISVAAKAYFVDVYKGKQQKSYTALITVVWGTAPLVAPFLGGYLQELWSWKANFYFLLLYGSLCLVFELFYGGESLKYRTDFRWKSIARVYEEIISTRDFLAGIISLGFSFAIVMAFNMSIPFIVEQIFELGPITTGKMALLSGGALLLGGLLGRQIGLYRLVPNLFKLSLLQFLLIAAFYLLSSHLRHLSGIMCFIFVIHFLEGVIYNLFFTHCNTRFPQYAASASGMAGGGSYIILYAAISVLLGFVELTSVSALVIYYLCFSGALLTVLFIFRTPLFRANRQMMKQDRRAEQTEVPLTATSE